MTPSTAGPAGRIARFFIDSKLTPLIIIASIMMGLGAVLALPREEEPQIIVPMIDIFVQMPGASAKEVEQRVTQPMEKLLWEIPGVEYIYSTSSPGTSMAVVRFFVGEDEEKSIVRLQSKLMSNMDRIPGGVTPPLIKPRYIDDVPILALTLWAEELDHYTLRRVAAEAENLIKREPNVSITQLIGGEPRRLEVRLDPVRLAAYRVDASQAAATLVAANHSTDSGSFPSPEGQVIIHAGGFLQTIEDVRAVVLGVHNGRPVYVRDVATVIDGALEPDQYVFFGKGPAAADKGLSLQSAPKGVYPAVTLTVAKRKGTNATYVAHRVLARLEDARSSVIPRNVNITVTRNYGETAKEKSNELLWHMLIAIASVSALIGITLGWRESGVVALAIPVTLALTLTVFYLYGYTLNRITLFALIFSIGILVDDAIVVVENVVRHFRLPENQGKPLTVVAVQAVDEVGNPTILATLTVIAAILPMAFVGGLMGPYMRPIPIGASAAVVFSLIVAFIVTPWASLRLLSPTDGASGHDSPHAPEDWSTRLYRRIMEPLIHHPRWRVGFLASVCVLLLAACGLVAVGLVNVKMLPFDNKSEFQVILDMPESATLEDTAAAALEMGDYLRTVNEVVDYEAYIGTSGPFNFNGLVRHYYLRRGPNRADLQVNLVAKDRRRDQSHEIAKRVRPQLQVIAERYHARVQVAEVPPGPPVLATLVAEIYGPDYDRQRQLARQIRDIMQKTPGVVDVDWYMEGEQPRYQLTVDREKAAMHGISVANVAETLKLSLSGRQSGLLHQPQEKEDVPIMLRPSLEQRAGLERLQAVRISSTGGQMVALADLVTVEKTEIDRSIYHKNLMPVIYVIGDLAGEKESPVYAILELGKKIGAIDLPEGYRITQHTAGLPESDRRLAMKWDGEWHITYEVFRDLGLAFGVVLLLIFVLVVGWFQSFSTPLTIMVAIPFSLIGILPAHWVMLTAAAVVVGASVILFDPIFQGLAISLMAGEVASLLFSRMTVPILYYLDKRWESIHLDHHATEVRSDRI
jgi:multidrug efflux pump subunit AcrB